MKPIAIILLLFLFLLSTSVFSQQKPSFFPEDTEAAGLKCYCKPGIQNKSRSKGLEISYHFISGSQLEEENHNGPEEAVYGKIASIQNIGFKLRVPVINKAGLKMLFGLKYYPEQYSFNEVGDLFSDVFYHLDDIKLKSTAFSAYINKPLNEKLYAGFRLRASFNGDYKGFANFDSRYSIYNISAMIGVKKSDDLEYGGGLIYATGFRKKLTIVPFLMYNRNFNEKWGVEAVLPAYIYARHNASEKTILLFGTKYNSKSYSIDIDKDPNLSTQMYEMNHSELRLSVVMEQQIHPWFWFNVEGGYQLNFSTDFESEIAPSFMAEPLSSPYFKVGLFISPPDRFMK